MIKINHKFKLGYLVVFLMSSVSAFAEDSFPGIQIDIPGLTVGEVSKPDTIVTKTGQKVSTSISTDIPKGKRPEQYPLHLSVSPGVNEMFSVSQGRINRVITPYTDPVLDTTNDIIFDKQGNVLLITPKNSEPISAFIREANNPSVAISVTMVPKAMPSREIHLTFKKGAKVSSYTPSQQAINWESSSSLQDVLSKFYQAVASEEGEIPPGYKIREVTSEDLPFYTCVFEGIETNLEQMIEGASLQMGVLSAKNETNYVLELDENSCQSPGAISAAVHPLVLKPGEWAEVFIIRSRENNSKSVRHRPKVIPQ